MSNPLLQKYIQEILNNHFGKTNRSHGIVGTDCEALKQIADVVGKAQKETAQDCYLQCLAVESGEGECALAIKTKFKL